MWIQDLESRRPCQLCNYDNLIYVHFSLIFKVQVISIYPIKLLQRLNDRTIHTGPVVS